MQGPPGKGVRARLRGHCGERCDAGVAQGFHRASSSQAVKASSHPGQTHGRFQLAEGAREGMGPRPSWHGRCATSKGIRGEGRTLGARGRGGPRAGEEFAACRVKAAEWGRG